MKCSRMPSSRCPSWTRKATRWKVSFRFSRKKSTRYVVDIWESICRKRVNLELILTIYVLALIIIQDSGASIDIGCGNEFGGGDDDVDGGAETVNNVVDESIGFDLHEIPMQKKDVKEYLTGFCKNL